jgi:hypothetical protein
LTHCGFATVHTLVEMITCPSIESPSKTTMSCSVGVVSLYLRWNVCVSHPQLVHPQLVHGASHGQAWYALGCIKNQPRIYMVELTHVVSLANVSSSLLSLNSE